MSAGNINFELKNTDIRDPDLDMTDARVTLSTIPVKILNVKDSTHGKLCILGLCAANPSVYAMASDGYTKDFAAGCCILDRANAKLRVNDNVTAPNWTAQA